MFARFVIIVNNANAMKKDAKAPTAPANRITVTLPPDLSVPANELSLVTGVSTSDLLRQGMIRILLEHRENGGVRLMQLPKPARAA